MSLKKWNTVDWLLVEKRVFRYQRRIYEASKRGDNHIVKGLQRRLLSSVDSKLFVVKKVTAKQREPKRQILQDELYVTSEEKIKLVSTLKINNKLSLQQKNRITRANIKNSPLLKLDFLEEKSKQALCFLALEPEWEGRIAQNCYGLRPGRWGQDAMESIYSYSVNILPSQRFYTLVVKVEKKKSLEDKEIKSLLDKLQTLSVIKNQLCFWLSPNYMQTYQIENKINDEKLGIKNKTSIFNFLSNTVLDELTENVESEINLEKLQCASLNMKRSSLYVIRYDADIIFLHEDIQIVKKADKIVKKWLQKNCVLKLSKRVISSSNEGFSFLKYRFLTIVTNGKTKLKISPTKESQTQLLSDIREIIQRNKSASSYKLITLLTPKIMTWADYYRYCECKHVFRKISHYTLQKLRAWAFRRDKRSGRKIVKERYFPSNREYTFEGKYYRDNWILNGYRRLEKDGIDEIWLPNLSWIQQKRWTEVIKSKSMYDGDHNYWKSRVPYDGVNYK
jgi:RNA-directed DNA polymerase